jgi:peptidoglycan/LPS O-acetylase OafA/YrhL
MSARRLDYIDSVRAIAALAVVYFHLAFFFCARGARLWDFAFFTEVVDAGKIGVVAFFIVSGMVIPHSLTREAADPIRRFAVRRFLRLYPAYWLSALLALAGLYLMEGKDWPGPFFLWRGDGEPVLPTFAVNLSMLQQFVGIPNLIGVYWTLQVELIFYVLCAALFLLRRAGAEHRLAFGFLACAVLAAAARGALGMRIPVALALALALMFWGSVWRRYVVDRDPQALRWSLRFLGAFALLMPLISVLGYDTDLGFHETWHRYALSYFSAVALVIVLTVCKTQGPVLSWLGRISYSIYLFHPLVLAAYFMLVPVTAFAPYVHVAFVIAITLCVAQLVYVLVEAPAMRYGRRLREKGPLGAVRVSP